MPFAPPPKPALPPRRRLRLVLDEIRVKRDFDLLSAGELTIRVTIIDSQKSERAVIELPGGESGQYRIRGGTVLDLSRELLDAQVDDEGVTVRIDATEIDCGPDDELPPLIFEHVGRRAAGRYSASAKIGARRRPEDELRKELGPWSASLRVVASPTSPSFSRRAVGARRS